jgi:uncharacterized protein
MTPIFQTPSIHIKPQNHTGRYDSFFRLLKVIAIGNLDTFGHLRAELSSPCTCSHSTFVVVDSNLLQSIRASKWEVTAPQALARRPPLNLRGDIPNGSASAIIKSMDNPNVLVEEMELGKGLIAGALIRKDEIVAKFDGPTYVAPRTSFLTEEIADHAIQIASNLWKDSCGIARYANHSCEPNLGYRGVDTLVAMRSILPGERLTVDYEMTERSDWRMSCLCKTPSCRGIIGTFDNLSAELREKYGGYISEWLRVELRAAA